MGLGAVAAVPCRVGAVVGVVAGAMFGAVAGAVLGAVVGASCPSATGLLPRGGRETRTVASSPVCVGAEVRCTVLSSPVCVASVGTEARCMRGSGGPDLCTGPACMHEGTQHIAMCLNVS